MKDNQKQPSIVCICGSGKFWEEMVRQRRRLTLEGKIVVGPEVRADDSVDADVEGSVSKPALDELHFRKIDISNEVFVVDIDTKKTGMIPYTGPSTNNEITYAENRGKPVARLSSVDKGAQ
jgi:hypothetical protein